MPLRLTVLENILARLNLLPMPLLDTPLAAGIAKVLVTACELDLFDTLGKGSLALDILAEKVRCDPQGLQLLLQLLVSAGYLKYQDGKYRNTAMARRWLTSTSSVAVPVGRCRRSAVLRPPWVALCSDRFATGRPSTSTSL